MRRLNRAFYGDADRGATALVMALLMTVILGFAGLAIDLGASYAKHSELQNTADAAALALAQEFALEPSPCATASGSGAADAWRSGNINNDFESASALVECDGLPSNQLRVVAAAVKEHWFMPVVGQDSSHISADATVEWGSPVAGAAFPLTIARCEFEHVLDAAGGAYDGTPIQLWVPNTNEGGGSGSDGPEYCQASEEETGGYPPGGFGWLTTDGECTAEYVDLNATAPIIDGSPGNDAPGDCDWSSLIGTTVIVPIFDEADPDSSTKDYYVSEFASLEIVALRIQSGTGNGSYPVGTTHCAMGSKPSDGKWTNHCLAAVFRGYVSLEDHWELGEVNPDGPLIVRLID